MLFGFGVAFLDLRVSGSWLAVVLIAGAFAALVLIAGLAAAAALSTIQQVNAVTNLGAMALGGLGGGFVPVESLPDWIEPIAPISPVYWAMEGYRSAILDGGGVGDVLGPLAVLARLHRRLRGDRAVALASSTRRSAPGARAACCVPVDDALRCGSSPATDRSRRRRW